MTKPVVFLPRDGPRAIVLAHVTFGRSAWPIRFDTEPFGDSPAHGGEQVVLEADVI